MDIRLTAPLQVLVVGGQPAASRQVCLQLAYQGYEALEVAGPAAAGKDLDSRLVDLILLDADLAPDLSWLRGHEQGAELPVCLMGERVDDEAVRRAAATGALAFLLRPIDMRKLVGLVRDLGERVRQRRERLFLRSLLAGVDESSLSETDRRKLAAQLERSELYRRFVADPGSVPPEFRSRLLPLLRTFCPTLSQTLLDNLDPASGGRVLDTLAVIDQMADPGGELGAKLRRLVQSGDERQASKAAKILGRTSRDPAALRSLLAGGEARLVANLIESMWERPTGTALEIFSAYATAEVARVRANSLVGLHLGGREREARAGLREMLFQSDPGIVRSAVWACGRVSDPALREPMSWLRFHPEDDIRQLARELAGEGD